MAIDARDVYLLNNMNSSAYQSDLGTELLAIQTAAGLNTGLADGKINIGDATGAAAEKTLSGDITMTREGVTTIGAGAVDSAMMTLADGTINVGNGSNIAAAVTLSGDATISNTGVVTIGASKIDTAMITDGNVTEDKLAAQSADGLHAKRIARATYDFTVDGGTAGTFGLGVTLPDNAIIVRAFYEVGTTFQSATGPDNATVAITIPTDGDLEVASAINAATDWDEGFHDCVTKGSDGTASEFLKLTAAREISLVIGVEDITAGALTVFIEYVIGA